MTIVYLYFIIYKANTIGGKYQDTEYYEDCGFRMMSLCGVM